MKNITINDMIKDIKYLLVHYDKPGIFYFMAYNSQNKKHFKYFCREHQDLLKSIFNKNIKIVNEIKSILEELIFGEKNSKILNNILNNILSNNEDVPSITGNADHIDV
jgi:hypothetical protein